MKRRTPTTPANVTRRRFWFGAQRVRFTREQIFGHAVDRWFVDIGPVQLVLFYRRGGAVNWLAIVYFCLQITDPELAEGIDPDQMRIALTRGSDTAEGAIAAAEELSVDSFAALGDALGYEVER